MSFKKKLAKQTVHLDPLIHDLARREAFEDHSNIGRIINDRLAKSYGVNIIFKKLKAIKKTK